MVDFIVRTAITAAALWAAVVLLPQLEFDLAGQWWQLIVISIVFGLINSLVKPIVKLLALPIRVMTLGLISFVIERWDAPAPGVGRRPAGHQLPDRRVPARLQHRHPHRRPPWVDRDLDRVHGPRRVRSRPALGHVGPTTTSTRPSGTGTPLPDRVALLGPSLRAAAKRFGTPAFITDVATLHAAADALADAFPDPWHRRYRSRRTTSRRSWPGSPGAVWARTSCRPASGRSRDGQACRTTRSRWRASARPMPICGPRSGRQSMGRHCVGGRRIGRRAGAR